MDFERSSGAVRGGGGGAMGGGTEEKTVGLEGLIKARILEVSNGFLLLMSI